MTLQLSDEAVRKRRDDWMLAIEGLLVQIEDWCEQLGWPTVREKKHFSERSIGEYDAPLLRARLPIGQVYVTPVALHIMGGADGRVDIEAWPSLNRVKLLREDGRWSIVTDSNVRLNEPWTRETFARVARELSV